MRLPDAIAPYASLIKWLLIGIIFTSLFIGGCQHGKNKSATKIAELKTQLRDTETSLKAAATSIQAVNAEAERRLAAEQAEKSTAQKAGLIAAAERDNLAQQIKKYNQKIEGAKRKPDCAALLSMDVSKTCGL